MSLNEYYQKAIVPTSTEEIIELYQSDTGDVEIHLSENNTVIITGIERVHDKLKEIQGILYVF